MISLQELLKPQNILVPMVAKDKTSAITELVDLLAASKEITSAQQVISAVLEREGMRTTGIGKGLAIPHGKSTGTEHLSMAIGKPVVPIEFQSIDGKPVSVVWLLTSPPDKTGPHINALARISRLWTIDKFCQAVIAAKTGQEVFEIIVQQEKAL
jgi:mannitol/fructose-specific phosphotransferase system IIA component (Ntr-type)